MFIVNKELSFVGRREAVERVLETLSTNNEATGCFPRALRDRVHCERTATVEGPNNPALNTAQSMATAHFPTVQKGSAC